MRTPLLVSLLSLSLLAVGLSTALSLSSPAQAQDTGGEEPAGEDPKDDGAKEAPPKEAPKEPAKGDDAKKGGIPADTEIQTTKTGLKYSVLTKGPGEGRAPQMGDKVKVHYTGWLLDGTEFDSSRKRGTPTEFKVGMVIDGWNEGLQLMHKGDRYKFTIPGELAYGASPPPGSSIPPDATLIFDVELLEVTEGVPLPVFKKLGEEAKSDESGLKYEVIKQGDGKIAGEKDIVRMHVAFWNAKGKMMNSSWGRDRPESWPANKFPLKVFKAAAKLMKAGSRYRFEAPPALVFGATARGPDLPANSITYWEIEILEVTTPPKAPDFSLPKDEELTTTKSGLKYQVVKKGRDDGKQPRLGQFVTVNYAGWLTDGTQFDSSFERGTTLSFQLGRVIKGWNEGLQLMKEGAIYRFVIPGDLAYGPNPRPGGLIKPNATLVFYVEFVRLGR